MDGLNLGTLTITALSEMLRTRAVSPVEVTQASLERIERLDAQLRSFTTVTPEYALERARQNIQAAQEALAEQARYEEDERRDQLTRWHEQDRAAELDQGRDDGPSLSRDY